MSKFSIRGRDPSEEAVARQAQNSPDDLQMQLLSRCLSPQPKARAMSGMQRRLSTSRLPGADRQDGTED